MKMVFVFLMLLSSTIVLAQENTYPCEKPTGDAAEVLTLIWKKSNSEFEAMLKKNKELRFAKSRYCESLYHYAIRARNEEGRKILDRLGYGPKKAKQINEEYEDMEKSFHWTSYFAWAMSFGLPETYVDLKKRGGKHDQYSGTNDLTWAVHYCNDSGLITHLVKSGIDVNWRELDGTQIFQATKNCKLSVIQELIRNGAELNEVSRGTFNSVESPLMNIYRRYKEKTADISYLEALIAAGADLNQGYVGGSLLMLSLEDKLPEIFQLLLNSGADVNALTDSYYGTVLNQVVGISLELTEAERLALVELLLSKGANVNLATKSFKHTPLYVAATGSPKVMELLIKNGADVRAKTWQDENILHQAACGQPKEVIAWLISLIGPDFNYANREGRYPTGEAIRCGREAEIIAMLSKLERR